MKRLRRSRTLRSRRSRRRGSRFGGGRKFSRNCETLVFQVDSTGTFNQFVISGNGGTNQGPPAVFNVGGATTGGPPATVSTVYPDRVSNAMQDIPFSMGFRFADITDAGDFTALFDQYRLEKIKITVRPQWNANDGSFFAALVPAIEWAYDRDDLSLPTPSTWLVRSGIRRAQLDKPVTFWVTPNMLTPVLTTQALGNYYPVVTGPKWVDCQVSDALHYGIKGFLRNVYLPPFTAGINVDGAMHMKIETKYYFSMRGQQ